jgi:hypothetical protein
VVASPVEASEPESLSLKHLGVAGPHKRIVLFQRRRTLSRFSRSDPIWLFVLCFLASGFIGASLGAKTLVLGQGKLPGAMLLHLGKVLSGQRVETNFQLTNKTGRAVELQAIPDCGCITVKLRHTSLRRGQTATGELWFNTAARNGAVGEAGTGFTLRNVLTGKTLGVVTVLAKLQPSITLSRSELSWSLVPGEIPGPRSISLTNSLPVAVDMSWRGPRLKDERLYSIRPDFEKIAAHGKGKLVVRLTRATVLSLYLNQLAHLRFRVARTQTSAPAKPWKLMLSLRAMPNIPFVVVPGSVILSASDFHHGVAYRNIRVDQAAGSQAVVLSVTPTDPHLSVKLLRAGVYRLCVRKPKHAMIGGLRIAYKWGPKKASMRVGVFVYK